MSFDGGTPLCVGLVSVDRSGNGWIEWRHRSEGSGGLGSFQDPLDLVDSGRCVDDEVSNIDRDGCSS